MARGEVIACRRPIAVSVGWDDEGEERGGERSEDLCFFLWGGGPEPSWSVERIKRKKNTSSITRTQHDNISSQC